MTEPTSFEKLRAAIEDDAKAGAEGLAICARLTAAVDAVVRELSVGHRGFTILATGGYGRAEMAPKSDIDLLFLTDDPALAAPAVDAILHGLWDRHFQVGYATRTVEQCLSLADGDPATATALLTTRRLSDDGVGEVEHADRWHRLRAALAEHLRGAAGERLLIELQRGMVARHERFGGSVYLLEPNLKLGPGGLRDLQVALWAAMIRHRVETFADLLPRGVSSPREARELNAARSFQLRTRNALHFFSGHAGDRLTFEYQQVIAQAFGQGGDASGVEHFMQAHYAHASVVQKRGRLMLERCIEVGRPQRRVQLRRIDAQFRLVNGHLSIEDGQLFERDPTQVMRLFSVARAEGVPIYGFARERAMEAAPLLGGEAGDAFRRHPLVISAFLEVLTAADDPFDALGDMHETGVLGAMLPEFGAVAHRTHHDMYHVYTVDIHTLHALRSLKALHRGELAASHPALHAAMALVGRTLPLYLALLMHDAGKALGRGHAVKGARLITPIGRRLGLPSADVRDTEWLVRDHLLMAHLSQRRDLSDPGLIRQFARQVGSPESLARLFILTWADASTTGPQAYTEWKATLLSELYAKGQDRLRRGLDLYEDPSRRVQRLRGKVSEALERRDRIEQADVNGETDRFFASLPTAYFERTRATDIARHILLRGRLKNEPLVYTFVSRPKKGHGVLHLACADRPGLLAIFAGALAAHRFAILTAEVHVTSDGVGIDVFQVRDASGAVPAADDPRFPALAADLAAVLNGETTVETLLLKTQRDGAFVWPDGPMVETRVTADQRGSDVSSIIDVKARDRVGLLHSIADTLARGGLTIALARVTTEGNAAQDTFYVTDTQGAKVADEALFAAVAEVYSRLESGL